MSFHIQDWKPLVIDYSLLNNKIGNDEITNKDTFEKFTGISLYDFLLALLQGRLIPICTEFYNRGVTRLIVNNSNLEFYFGSEDSADLGIRIEYDNVDFLSQKDTYEIAKIISDTCYAIHYYEI